MLPVVTVVGLQFAGLLGGAVVTETIFSWPGLGRLAVTAILTRDFPIVQGTILVSAVTFVTINVLTDFLYAVLDPRIKYT
jgi:ABC-type dipeptide/oligopeptide/nickel transport system permease component